MLEGKYNFKETEEKWQNYWQDKDIYKFDAESNAPVYSIDTPPPTVNGKIHMGHLSSYMHIDTQARHHRMKGENVYFPFGFDDNGLPTERYVEKKFKKHAHEMSREDFIDLCLQTTAELEKEFHALYKSAGFSCNLKNNYSTISKSTQKISQTSFLELYKKGHIYHAEAPALWCTECRTAVAQSELDSEDKESTFNYIKFFISGTKEYVTVATTRPEMLPACVCVFINPNDKKNLNLLGKKVIVPYFNFEVEVIADDLVDLEKGSGVVMCCTFGDTVDKEWQRKHNLPIKECFNNAGRMTALAGEFEGLKISEARNQIIEKLKENDLLIRQESLTHAVSTHERCGTPIEIVVKKQWFIDVLKNKEKLYQAGLDLNWYPLTMRARYLNWVENLQWNWCISRQRYYGVAFPVWYCKKCGEPIFANEKDLPVNPLKDKPKCACKCGSTEFVPETDVMDTWATSSLSPEICTNILTNKGLNDSMVPMNLRPNAHDNIRVWDFYTIVKSLYHFNKLPWKDLMISGFVTSPDGTKLAKSKANGANSPQEILANNSADVTRYWANNMALGKDTCFSTDAFDIGKKLVNKIWNASKFVLSFIEDYKPTETKLLPMDAYALAKLFEVQNSFIKHLDKYEIALAINELERYFWSFCDNYIEIAKNRLYKPEIYGQKAKESAQYTCHFALLAMLKMFSIFLPHISEEIYMEHFAQFGKSSSVHISKYLDLTRFCDSNLIKDGEMAFDIVSLIRQFKSENKISLKNKIYNMEISSNNIDFMKSIEADIKAVGSIENITYVNGEIGIKVYDFEQS